MSGPLPQTQTTILVALFLLAYLLLLLQQTLRARLDLYDLLLLSSLAVLPGAFVLFPRFSYFLSTLVGVRYPFVILFGGLFFVSFVALHRLTVKHHRLEERTRSLIQEAGLLRQAIEQGEGHRGDDRQAASRANRAGVPRLEIDDDLEVEG